MAYSLPTRSELEVANGLREKLRGVALVFRAAFSVAPRSAIVAFTAEPIGQGLVLVSTAWFRAIVDGIVTHDAALLRRGVLGTTVAWSLGQLISFLGWRHRMALRELVGNWFEERIFRRAAEIPGIEHHERADFQDRMHLLRWAGSSLGSTVNGVVPILSTIARVTIVTVLLAQLHPVLVLLPVFGLPSIWFGAVTQRLIVRVNEANAEDDRRSIHLFGVATTAEAGKEIRIFDLRRAIEERFARLGKRMRGREAIAQRRAATLKTIGGSVFAAGYIGAVAFVAQRAADGTATPGDVFLILTLAGQVQGLVAWGVHGITWVMDQLRGIGHFLWLESYAAQHRADGMPEVPEPLRDGICFEDVTFRYPGTERPVLADVSLQLPAGARVAIVGDNGAGKSTLVKLLCGFYTPSDGRITIDGVDLAQLDPSAWRERIAAGFQDYCRFELLAGETVGIGNLESLDDLDAVRGSLDRAGASDLEAKLRDGFATQLGRSFDGGVDLSMGQWQKLALGRAFMRSRPVLLILDEPTASLDALTERALFDRYAMAASARREDGAITILVSHRFSTVRSADLIVVVDDGRIVEQGSHEELLARAGLYAELFGLQASSYR